jgi:hypothetical protein
MKSEGFHIYVVESNVFQKMHVVAKTVEDVVKIFKAWAKKAGTDYSISKIEKLVDADVVLLAGVMTEEKG